MSNLWKAFIVIAVIIIAAIIIVPKMVEQTPVSDGTSADGSSLATIEKTVKNGKPTLLLLRSAT
jgi:hypothetical protein